MKIALPLHTVSLANQREHWRARHRRHRAQRGVTLRVLQNSREFRLLAERQSLESARRLVVTLSRIAPRALDDDNLCGAMKAVRDGVADALETDDRDPLILWVYAQRRGAPRQYGVEIEIVARNEARKETA